jgi:hypothetical protein
VNDEERRSMLRSLTDEQYDDIMNVLSIYPDITMKTSWGGMKLILFKQIQEFVSILFSL